MSGPNAVLHVVLVSKPEIENVNKIVTAFPVMIYQKQRAAMMSNVQVITSTLTSQLFKTRNTNNIFLDYSMWSEWGECSQTCGNGIQTRTQQCKHHCDGIPRKFNVEGKNCNDFNCPGETSQLFKTNES